MQTWFGCIFGHNVDSNRYRGSNICKRIRITTPRKVRYLYYLITPLSAGKELTEYLLPPHTARGWSEPRGLTNLESPRSIRAPSKL